MITIIITTTIIIRIPDSLDAAEIRFGSHRVQKVPQGNSPALRARGTTDISRRCLCNCNCNFSFRFTSVFMVTRVTSQSSTSFRTLVTFSKIVNRWQSTRLHRVLHCFRAALSFCFVSVCLLRMNLFIYQSLP